MPKTAFEASRFSGFWFEPETLILITDKADPLYDRRVELAPPDGLVRDIAFRGIVEPVIVTRRGTSAVVVDGRQRVKAACEANVRLKAAGRETIKVPCFLRGGEDADLFGVLIAANEHRLSDGPMERARKAQKLVGMGRTADEVAITFGVSVTAVTKWLKIFDLPKDVRDRIEAGQLSVDAALQLRDLAPAVASAVAEKAAAAGEVAAAAAVVSDFVHEVSGGLDLTAGGGKKVGVRGGRKSAGLAGEHAAGKREKLQRAPRTPTAKQVQRAAQKVAAAVIADEVGIAGPKMKSRKQVEERLEEPRLPPQYKQALEWVLGYQDKPTPAQEA